MTNKQHQKRVRAAADFFAEAAIANPQLSYASEQMAIAMCGVIDFLEKLDPALTRAEATLLASGVLNALPDLLSSDPRLLEKIRDHAKNLRAGRRGQR